MKNELYPQPYQTTNGSFDDYDSVIGNEFSVNSASTKNNNADGGGDSHYSDDMSSLGHSHMGPPSAANSPARMTTASAAAASTNPQSWRPQRTPMTPMSSGSSDDGLHVGDVSVILAGGNGRTPGGGGDIESVGGDSLFMMSPPVVQPSRLERDATEWNPKPTHRYDAGTSKYLQLGPLGDELSFGGNNASNNNHPNFQSGLNLNAGADSDDEDDETTVGFLPQGRFGNCVMIGSTILVVGALIISVVAILNLNAIMNNQNDSPKFNIDAAGGMNDVIPATLAPTVPPSTLAPTVPPSTVSPTSEPTVETDSPTSDPTVVTDSPTSEPIVVTDSPTAMPIVLVLNDTDSPVSSISTVAPSKEPTTDAPTNIPTLATPAPTSSAPSKEPTTDTPTNIPTLATPAPTSSAPIEAIMTDEPTPAPSKAPTASQPTNDGTEVGSLTTTPPSKAPSTDSPTISHQPTLSPTKQTLLTAGTGAFNENQDIRFYLVADDLYVRQYWKNKFEKLVDSRSRFMIHVGSATPASEDCPEEAYERTEKSLSFSPVRAFSVPGNNDYPNCPNPSLAWKNYTEHLMNIDQKYWDPTSRYQVKRDPEQTGNFAFIFRRALFVGLNMVSNEDEDTTATRLEKNLQWVYNAAEPHEKNIDVIFLTGHGRLRDLPTFRDAIVEKKQGEWKDKMVVYARRAGQTNVFTDVEGTKDFHELTVGAGWPITDIHLDMTSKDAPRVGYRYQN
ncbi:hypothetical protein ACHAWT_001838 [Skeletonema menzelii]